MGAIFCIGFYYLLSAWIEIFLTRHGFNGVCFFLTSILFFCSLCLFIKKSRYSDLFFAGALVSASVLVFNAFKAWVWHRYALFYAEWTIVGGVIVALFFWWSANIILIASVEHGAGIASHSLNCDRWRASAGCVCLVILVFSNIIITGIFIITKYSNAPLLYTVSFIAFLIITISFSRVKNLNIFKDRFGLFPPNVYTATLAVLLGAVLALLLVLFVRDGFIEPHNRFADNFGNKTLWYFNYLLVLAPFCEELIIRGYLYKAFRSDFSVAVCVCFISAITCFSHFAAIIGAPSGAAFLICLNIILSLLREKTNCIWNCVACHLAYNAVCVFG